MASSGSDRRQELFVAVLGLTGSGKSTFINTCAGRQIAETGSRLTSVTQEPKVCEIKHRGRTVNLIDTPGFDDTEISDADRLQELSLLLTQLYKQEIKLAGIIYLHDIRRERIGGTGKKNIRIIEKLTGAPGYSGVTVATNFWDPLPAHAEEHEEELEREDMFFGQMIKGGAHFTRLSMVQDQCLGLLDSIMAKSPITIMQIQRELILEGKTFMDTAAGQEVFEAVVRASKHNEEQIQQLQAQLAQTLGQLEASNRGGNILGRFFRWLGRGADSICSLM